MKNTYFKGENIFLYVKFPEDVKNISDVKVKIAHDDNGEIIVDLNWVNMQRMSLNEFFSNYKIPLNSSSGQYQIIYYGLVNGQDSCIMESFHVVDKSKSKNMETIKIFGYVNDEYDNNPLENVSINIKNSVNNSTTKSSSNYDGYWESYVYPGEYVFEFNLFEYETIEIIAQINMDSTEIQFNNISMINKNRINNIMGNFLIKDQYVLKDGTPITNLSVNIYDVYNPIEPILKLVTNNKGEWDCYLNEGSYLVKIDGNFMNKKLNKTFRLKIESDGKYEFNDISDNLAVVTKRYENIEEDGKIKKTDCIKDRNGNGIVNVQVNIFEYNKPLEDQYIIDQTYTDPKGEWSLFLKPGKYKIEYYHPNFKPIVEELNI